MVAGFQLDGEQRETPVPIIKLVGLELTVISSEPAATVAYRVDGGPWHIYTGPVELDGERSEVEARAVRYGWQESDITRQRIDR